MDAFRRLVFTAVIAGLISGGLVTLAHHFGAASIIARAEVYEKAADNAGQRPGIADTQDHAAAGTTPDLDHHATTTRSMPGMDRVSATAEWEPAEGMERTLFTALADMITAIAFSLMLVAAFELRGETVDWRSGLFWGLAGFAIFTLAPGLGLPPEVPGTVAAPLHARQIWWIATAAATAAGLALLFLQRRPLWSLAGVVLLVAPHLYGAPQPAEYKSVAPAALAHEFVVSTTTTSLLFWIALGTLSGFFFDLLKRSSQHPETLDGFSAGRAKSSSRS